MSNEFPIYDFHDKTEADLRALCDKALAEDRSIGDDVSAAKLGKAVTMWADHCDKGRRVRARRSRRIQNLATRFGAKLRQAVGEDTYKNIRSENAIERSRRIAQFQLSPPCASYKYCDAGAIMTDALSEMLDHLPVGESLDDEATRRKSLGTDTTWKSAWSLWHIKDEDAYIASDGGLWYISCDSPPIPTRDYDWCAQHEDYDGGGAEWEPKDDRVMRGKSREDVIEQVEAYVAEHAEDDE